MHCIQVTSQPVNALKYHMKMILIGERVSFLAIIFVHN